MDGVPVTRWGAPWDLVSPELRIEGSAGALEVESAWVFGQCLAGQVPGEPITVRFRVEAPGLPPELAPGLALFGALDGSVVTADGREVGRTGVEAGLPSRMGLDRVPLGDALADGAVDVEIRLTGTGRVDPLACASLAEVELGHGTDLDLYAGLVEASLGRDTGTAAAALLGMAGLGVYQAVLWLRSRDPAAGWFAAMLLVFGGSGVAQMAWRGGVIPFPPWCEWGLDVALAGAVAALVQFLDRLFELRWRLAGGLPAALVLAEVLDGVIPLDRVTAVGRLGVMATLLAMLAHAAWRRLPESGTVLAGLLPMVGIALVDSAGDLAGLALPAWLREAAIYVIALPLLGAFLLALAGRHGRTHAELVASHARVTRLLAGAERFVPRGFLEALGRPDVASVEPNDRVARRMTILVTDIRGYTALSERLGPEGTARLTEAALAAQDRCVRVEGGFVDKYVGDAVMALFTDPAAAGRAAVAIAAEARALGVPLGLGLHTGDGMLGTVGSAERLACTVLGDAPNLATRVESATRPFDAVALATAAWAAEAPGHAVRALGPVGVKGRAEPVVLLELLDCLSPEERAARLATLPRFDAARGAWLAGDVAGARAGWAALADDPVARALAGLVTAPGPIRLPTK